jgi:hypothetical protein
MINQIKRFSVKNTAIVVILMISIIIIISYVLTMDVPELFPGAEKWFNLLFQLSVGYLINFMFYVTQVYIPKYKRDLEVNKCIKTRVESIIRTMKEPINQCARLYLINHTGMEYSKEELQVISKLNFNDRVQVMNVQTMQNFTVRDWISLNIFKVDEEIDKLFKYYSSDVSEKLMNVLERILKSQYHSTMKTLVSVATNVTFSEDNYTFFTEYYDLAVEAHEICDEDYS